MGASPVFASTPVIWQGTVPATADTSKTAPTNATTLGTAGTNGVRIEEVVVEALGTTVLGVVRLFIHDGSAYHLFDEFLIAAYSDAQTTLGPRYSKNYSNLILPNNYSLRATCSNSGNQSMLKVTALGAAI